MAVIVDRCANINVFSALEQLNIKYYKSASIDYLYLPVNTHPDMQIHFLDESTAVCAPLVFDYYRTILPEYINIIKGSANPDGTYPGDCAYNIAVLGKRVIGNLSYVDSVITDIYNDLGYEFINVKQGYSKCNLCIVDSNSVITEDEGLFKILTSHNINVLKISKGYVSLKHFENGFIGGASGFVSKNRLAFCGDLSLHRDYFMIKNFIEEQGVDIIQLSQTQLADYGSILYMKDFPD